MSLKVANNIKILPLFTNEDEEIEQQPLLSLPFASQKPSDTTTTSGRATLLFALLEFN
jgi:hypothetical protein